MTKSKEKASTIMGMPMYFGSDAMTAGFEKSTAFFNSVQEFNKDTAEAYMEAATKAGEGIQSINNEIYAYSKKVTSDNIDAAKTAMGTKSVHELVEHQSKFAKSGFDSYVAQLTKLGELFTTVTKSSFSPLESRVQAFGDFVSQTVRI